MVYLKFGGRKFGIMKTNPDISAAIVLVPLFGSVFSGLYVKAQSHRHGDHLRPLYVIYVWIGFDVRHLNMYFNLNCMAYCGGYSSLKTENI